MKRKELVNHEQHRMSCNGGVMNVNQRGLMRNSSIWVCSLQSNETAMMRWHPALITSSCSRALLGKQR